MSDVATDQSGIPSSQESWERFWNSHFESGFIQKLLYIIRTRLIARSVRHFVERYFPDQGIFVEAGSGSSQSSSGIYKRSRRLYSLDVVYEALSHARQVPVMDGGIQSDIFVLPFPDDSVDGIWNLGVIEHFTDGEIDRILTEFSRVLKKGVA